MLAKLRTASSFWTFLVFLALCGLTPSQPAFALVCGDGLLDPGEDCELPFDACCDSMTCQFTVCDDGNPCTVDSCDGSSGCSNSTEPRETCLVAERTRIAWKDHPSNDELDFLRWNWKRGAGVTPAELGTPRTSTSYAICIYDQVGSVTVPVTGIEVPPSASFWGVRPERIEYVDRTGSVEGVRKILVRAGVAGKTKARFGASGEPLDLPPPGDPDFHFLADPAVIVQMVNSDEVCWTSSFGREDIKRNRAGDFKAATR